LRALKKLYDLTAASRRRRLEAEKEKQPVEEEVKVVEQDSTELPWKEETMTPIVGVDVSTVQRSYLSYERVANSTMFIVGMSPFINVCVCYN